MRREFVLRVILKSVFLVIFNALFFILGFNTLFFVLGGTEHNASVWISYSFIHFAYFMLLLMPKLIPDSQSREIFKASIYAISLVYFLVELVTGVFFILIALESYKITFLVQLCIAGVYGVILTLHMIANEWTADAEKKRQPQIAYIKDASIKVKDLLEGINDKETKRKVERVYDALYSSPVKSYPDLEAEENRIRQSIRTLEEAVSSGNTDCIISLASSLEVAIHDRNRRLAMYN